MSRIVLHVTDAPQPYHCVISGDNGEPVWWTEQYADERDALHAIELLPGQTNYIALEAGARVAFLNGMRYDIEVDDRREPRGVPEDGEDAVPRDGGPPEYDGPDDPAGLGTPHNHLSREVEPEGRCPYCDYLVANRMASR